MDFHPLPPSRGRRTGRGDNKGLDTFESSGGPSMHSYLHEDHPDSDEDVQEPDTSGHQPTKAVLIGLDYTELDEDELAESGGPYPYIPEEDKPMELSNAIGDTFGMRIDLNSTNGYPFNNIRVYTDVEYAHGRSNRAGILRAINWLTSGAKDGDSLFFYFAGHGRYDDVNGESMIVTVDGGTIRGSELRRYLVDGLPAGCNLTAVFDCCHAGNMLNLRYSYSSLDEMKNNTPRMGGTAARARVISWSPVSEYQTAADGESLDGSSGYMSNAFFRAKIGSYFAKYSSIVRRLPRHQTPMVCASFPIRKDDIFYL